MKKLNKGLLAKLLTGFAGALLLFYSWQKIGRIFLSPQSQTSLEMNRKRIQYLQAQGLSKNNAKLLVAQSLHETGNYTSRLFREQNNAFGMKVPRQRKVKVKLTSNQNTNKEYLHYETVNDSDMDFLDYARYNGLIVPLLSADLTPAVYVQFLKQRGYFEDTTDNYLRSVEFYFSKLDV